MRQEIYGRMYPSDKAETNQSRKWQDFPCLI